MSTVTKQILKWKQQMSIKLLSKIEFDLFGGFAFGSKKMKTIKELKETLSFYWWPFIIQYWHIFHYFIFIR